MRVVTVSDVLSWKPDVTDRFGWGDRSGESGKYTKTELGHMSDLRDMGHQVWIVRIVNFYGDSVAAYRFGGSSELAEKTANEVLNTFCRRFPGSPFKYDLSVVRETTD